MKKVELRVKANAESGVLVAHLEALDAGMRRYVGRVRDSSLRDVEAQVDSGWPATDEPTTLTPSSVDHLTQYLLELKHGHLLPADEPTARLAGVRMPASATTSPPKAASPRPGADAPAKDSASKEPK